MADGYGYRFPWVLFLVLILLFMGDGFFVDP